MDDYKVDHLFLLVGKNPLPNYVVGKSNQLLRERGKAYLVYTTDTKPYADKLKDKLGLSNKDLISLGNYQSDAYEIQERIKGKARELKGRLGLNYTGGTKAMSVNAYLAIRSLERDEAPVFSYLDAKSIKLCIDQPNRSPIQKTISEPLKLADLFDLHTKDLSLKGQRKEVLLPALVTSLAKYSNEWNAWRSRKEIKQVLEKNRDNLLGISNLPGELVDAFKSENLLIDNACISLAAVQKKCGFKSLKEASIWLTGKWLEDFVMLKVAPLSKRYGTEHGTSFEVYLAKDGQPTEKSQFEFDVAFMKGYQLFAFSCTTSSKSSRCKAKLFEAYIRARQLGGEEARVGLVCCSDNPDVLKNQFKSSIAAHAINVFGQNQLSNLTEEISSWISELEAQEK
ncbi:MAG: hypothetical protein WA885_13810 [Phormidesmis sp.]